MKPEDLPILSKVSHGMNVLIVNFILLAVICLILGVVIPFFPQVLNFLVAALLIVAGFIFLNIAYNIYTHKKKLFHWFN